MEITVDYLKDKVHEQQELRKSYDELTKSALKLDKIVKEKQEEIDQLKSREEEHQRLNGELREEIERLNNIIEKLEQENAVLKTQVVNKDKYSYGIRMGSDKE